MTIPDPNPAWSDFKAPLLGEALIREAVPADPDPADIVDDGPRWDRILTDRHPGTVHLARLLRANPRLDGRMREVAVAHERLAADMVANVPDGPELTAGLRKLLEAKDCMVRALL